MTATGMAVFETAIGHAAIAWRGSVITRVHLPAASVTAAEARLRAQVPSCDFADPPPKLTRVVERILAAMRGETVTMPKVALAWDDVADFDRRVYEAVREIPRGTTRTRTELAAQLGAPEATRAVAQALARNPFPILVPCHRVLAANRGSAATGDAAIRARILELEGVAATLGGTPRSRRAPQRYDATAALAHLRAADPTLGKLIDRVGACRLEVQPETSTFAALSRSIVYQQLTGKAAATIYGRVCAACCGRTDAAPTPEGIMALSDPQLRGAGLSGSKLLALRDLARRTIAGEVPPLARLRRMSDDAIVECLTQVRGIGRWSVEMLLMFRLGRTDVLPLDDYGVRKGFARAFGKRELPTKDQLARRGARWQPYRTIASWYLWRATEPPE